MSSLLDDIFVVGGTIYVVDKLTGKKKRVTNQKRRTQMPKLGWPKVGNKVSAKSKANDKERKRIKKEAEQERKRLLRKRR